MHKQSALIDFSHYSQPELGPAATIIYTDMTANPVTYPNPKVAMSIFNNQIANWNTIYNKPDYDGKAGDLNKARTVLETSLRDNGIYVNSIAKGDLALLQKSGYPLSKLRTPVGDLLPPDSVDITNGIAPGTFDIDIAIVDNAWGYLLAFTAVSNTEKDPNLWTIKWSAKHTNTFGGFISGTQYKFAACAVGSSNNVFWKNAPNNLFAQ